MCTINKEDLRLCEFTLEMYNEYGNAQLGAHDYDNDPEREEATQTRTGRFHTWGFASQPQMTDGKIIACAIVEDINDGKVYCINSENIRFID